MVFNCTIGMYTLALVVDWPHLQTFEYVVYKRRAVDHLHGACIPRLAFKKLLVQGYDTADQVFVLPFNELGVSDAKELAGRHQLRADKY